MRRNDKPLSRKEKLELIVKILEAAKKLTDAGYGKIMFVEEREHGNY